MGNVCVRDPAAVKNTEINTDLRKESVVYRETVRLLLLGAGESGKSTIVKQMKIIHSDGFSDEEREAFRAVLFFNLIESMRALVDNMDLLGLDYEKPELEKAARQDLYHPDSLYRSYVLDPHYLKLIQKLWQDNGVQQCFKQAHQFHISDGAHYLFNKITQYMEEGFTPTARDILHIRVKTTSIIETEFTYKAMRFQLVDVGGQRAERRKWIHVFDNITAILFIASLSGYDSTCEEDALKLKLHESLDIFESICNSKILSGASLILMLNKMDILKKKVYTSPLTICFPEYTGQQTYDEVVRYIEAHFRNRVRIRQQEQVYIFKTCATDTHIIDKVFQAAADTILHDNLSAILS